MTIRELQPTDIERVIPLLQRVHAGSPYRCVQPDWAQVINTLVYAADKRFHLTLVAEHKGKLTGILIAVTETFWWVNPQLGAKIASDLVFYSLTLGDGRRMLQWMVEWAFQTPRVVRVQIAYSTDHPAHLMDRLYRSAGFAKVGSFWVVNHPRYQALLDGIEQAA